MTIDLGYLLALGDARSCLAALADGAADEVAASHFEHLLIALDTLEPEGPATWSVTADPDALLARLDAAVDRLVERGSDALVLLVIVALASHAANGTAWSVRCLRPLWRPRFPQPVRPDRAIVGGRN